MSTCCHSALHVPPPYKLTFLQADVTLIPVNLAVLLRPIGNGSFCIPRQRFRDVSPLSQTLTEESFGVFFPPKKAGYFLSCNLVLHWKCVELQILSLYLQKEECISYLFTIQDGVILNTLDLSSFHFSAVK